MRFFLFRFSLGDILCTVYSSTIINILGDLSLNTIKCDTLIIIQIQNNNPVSGNSSNNSQNTNYEQTDSYERSILDDIKRPYIEDRAKLIYIEDDYTGLKRITVELLQVYPVKNTKERLNSTH